MQHEQPIAKIELPSKLFCASIPAYILDNENLTANSKLIWGIIAGFSLAGRKCFVSNAALARALKIDDRSARRCIAELLEDGALRSESDTGRRILVPIMQGVEYRDEVAGSDNSVRGGGQFCPGGEDNSVPHNNKLSTSPSKEGEGPAHYAKSLEQEIPPEFSGLFDLNTQDISTGRMQLKKYPHIWIHPHELKDAREKYKRANLTLEEWRDSMKLCHVECERHKKRIDYRGGIAYKYLIGFILTDALEQKKKRNQSQGYYGPEPVRRRA